MVDYMLDTDLDVFPKYMSGILHVRDINDEVRVSRGASLCWFRFLLLSVAHDMYSRTERSSTRAMSSAATWRIRAA